MDYQYFTLEQLLNAIPENRPLYCDSGLWQIRTDDMEDIYIQQKVSQDLKDMIIDYIELLKTGEPELIEEIYINLACYINK